jgi:Icc-related predicted phosphoesterase
MLSFLYVTDLHGSITKFEAALALALELQLPLIHLGGDLLPKSSDIFGKQKKFVNGYLQKFYSRCHLNNIDVLAFWGNDDIYTRKKYFLKYATLLDETPYTRNGYTFKAYPYVQDLPFGLKTAAKRDSPGWVLPDPDRSIPVDVTEQGIVPIRNINKYFQEKGSIQEDLKAIHANSKTVMAIHQPPWGLGLDVCINGRRVGSKAVYEWIEREQPLVCLSGHIHESPEVSGIWKAHIGRTLVIQPGQKLTKTVMALVELSGTTVKATLIEKNHD